MQGGRDAGEGEVGIENEVWGGLEEEREGELVENGENHGIGYGCEKSRSERKKTFVHCLLSMKKKNTFIPKQNFFQYFTTWNIKNETHLQHISIQYRLNFNIIQPKS